MDKRCDAGLPSGRRCKNDATQWIHLSLKLNRDTTESWPVAVCDAHAEPQGACFHRMGPDRHQEYAEYKQQAQPSTEGSDGR